MSTFSLNEELKRIQHDYNDDTEKMKEMNRARLKYESNPNYKVDLLTSQYGILPDEGNEGNEGDMTKYTSYTRKRRNNELISSANKGARHTYTLNNIHQYKDGPTFPPGGLVLSRPKLTREERRLVQRKVIAAAALKRKDEADKLIDHANVRLPLIGVHPIERVVPGGRRTRKNRKSRKRLKRNHRKSRR